VFRTDQNDNCASLFSFFIYLFIFLICVYFEFIRSSSLYTGFNLFKFLILMHASKLTLFHPLIRSGPLPWYSNTTGSCKFPLLGKTDASSRPLHWGTVSSVICCHNYFKLLTADLCVWPALSRTRAYRLLVLQKNLAERASV